MAERRRRTKIIATLGPASSSAEKIGQLIDAGVDVFRLNFSHGTHESHGALIALIRKAAQEKGRAVAVLQDLQGPKIRIGELKGHEPIALAAGQRIRIVTTPVASTAELLSTTYEAFPDDVRIGDPILLDDGRIQLKAISAKDRTVLAEVTVGGLLDEHKGMNLPGTPLSAPSLTEKDLADLHFGIAQKVDYVAISFVRHASDVLMARHEIAAAGADMPVIAKIERIEAIQNLEEILLAADGVMVARGDLGVETSAEDVPLYQKRILSMAGKFGKLDITATQMLETMVNNPQPSRAEATDIANAVFDGTDAVMLSAESAVGKYPVEAVTMMGRICLAAEEHLKEYGRQLPDGSPRSGTSVGEATAHAACLAARELGAAAIAVFTLSGRSARLVAARRPYAPILAFTPEQTTFRRLALAWGVIPMRTEYADTAEKIVTMQAECVRRSGFGHDGDVIIMLTGTTTTPGATNSMRIWRVGDRE